MWIIQQGVSLIWLVEVQILTLSTLSSYAAFQRDSFRNWGGGGGALKEWTELYSV